EPVDVALKEPGWRIARVLPRQDTHHRTDVRTRHERLHAVQQHRFPGNPAKLLQLSVAGARARATRHDDDADVARGGRRGQANTRCSTSCTVRTPTTCTSRGPFFGTPRSATNTRFIPRFAASAMRRSVCDTGRTSPPNPTSPMKT